VSSHEYLFVIERVQRTGVYSEQMFSGDGGIGVPMTPEIKVGGVNSEEQFARINATGRICFETLRFARLWVLPDSTSLNPCFSTQYLAGRMAFNCQRELAVPKTRRCAV
jgi:hypothetical protein